MPLADKKELLDHLVSQYQFSENTKTLVFVHSDLVMRKEDTIDEEVLLAAQGYLSQHSSESPCLVTNPIQLNEVLQCMEAHNQALMPDSASSSHPSLRDIQLVALGHYCAGLEPFNAYRFVNTIVENDYVDEFEDHKYFAGILNRYEFITKFRALGCITARFKEAPDYSEQI